MNKPTPLEVSPANVPQELKDRPQWVLWRYELAGAKWTKPPYRPDGFKASKTNPAHYSTFQDVMAAYEKGGFHGVGFVLTAADPFVAIDIDHFMDDQDVMAEALRIIEALNSYTELSPSGNGLHIWVKGTVPSNVKKSIEIYSYDSYVTVTGQLWAQ